MSKRKDPRYEVANTVDENLDIIGNFRHKICNFNEIVKFLKINKNSAVLNAKNKEEIFLHEECFSTSRS